MSDDKHFWIVTGAASGIGAAVIRAVTAAGHRALALDVNDPAGEALAAETGAIYRHCDVTDHAVWQQLVTFLETSRQELGVPTRIHLNAGVQLAPPSAPLSEFRFDAMTVDRYRRLMGVNVDGVVFGLHTLLPLLQPGASIVVTDSLAGITPYALDPLYSLSKHAVTGLVRSLGPVLARREIRINAICPGGIDTALVPVEQRSAKIDFMTPEHVAAEVMALMEKPESGKTWAKVSESKPIFIVRAPGDKPALTASR
ncbi:MAG: SDR family NAD(P)-dependent oxidoreductase [Proteobacteria bacterium]|nr:SDR family NAD(P)-dependent oxidoreductase [Pseudomonadota bacterium]